MSLGMHRAMIRRLHPLLSVVRECVLGGSIAWAFIIAPKGKSTTPLAVMLLMARCFRAPILWRPANGAASAQAWPVCWAGPGAPADGPDGLDADIPKTRD